MTEFNPFFNRSSNLQCQPSYLVPPELQFQTPPPVASGCQLLHQENQTNLLRQQQQQQLADRLKQLADNTLIPFSLVNDQRQNLTPPGVTLTNVFNQPVYQRCLQPNQVCVPVPVMSHVPMPTTRVFDDNRDYKTRYENELILNRYYDQLRDERFDRNYYSNQCSSYRSPSPDCSNCHNQSPSKCNHHEKCHYRSKCSSCGLDKSHEFRHSPGKCCHHQKKKKSKHH